VGVRVSGPERPVGAAALGAAARRCLCPARCPYAAARGPAGPVGGTVARLLLELLPGDPHLALDLVADLGLTSSL
jgi:hypothetical protein